ncbi:MULTISPECIES: PhzF family phenazine biosynthesis protein [Paraburkholderia]|uniref:PhzF family phenazine biosynthesis protein n=1 Tax=Paraburkholderia TaxID=1822464 RepID=UPI0022513611|nr:MULTISPECIES: PhzF family phenazine biosynthesis protein [Paraburkholderia]MCX4163491.1 PhzF family phenazine biosynthesis protein [Paraburkholderia megapolitana]MDN7158986.1 PhzF family phenazine biosynthesis protein [Paraburkholderia sp. CHISQ3]MDQ6496033.1 PhzF family phenazine biosynthesis protein [Paraburkholderia megapolitana]
MNTHRMLCFGRTDASGNAAIVVEDFALSESERLEFARRQDAAATVFVTTDAAGDIVLDYYYPHTRSPLCLHATLAASAVLFERNPDSARIQFVTSMHRQVLEVERTDDNILIGLKPQRCPELNVDLAETAQLLRAKPIELMGMPRLASVGSAKLLVEVANQSALQALRPDLAAIAAWSRAHGVSGLYAYCGLADDVYAGRNFNHLEPCLEDAATGVAVGALAVLLKRSITLLQGDALGQPCTLAARYLDGAVQVGGRATSSSV